ncbi:MAG: hypothetical protein ACSHXY_14795 [Alphaproteobacteria bacterium]
MTSFKYNFPKTFTVTFGLTLIASLCLNAAAQTETVNRSVLEQKKEAPKRLIANPSRALSAQPSLAAAMLNQQNGWTEVGTKNFNETYGEHTQIVVAPNGNVFVAYLKTFDRLVHTGYQSDLYMSKYDGNSWSQIDAKIEDVNFFDLAIDSNGVPYVAFQHDVWPPYQSSIEVARLWNGNWDTLGSTRMKGATRKGAEVSLDIDKTTNTPYIAYGNGDFQEHPRHSKVTVRKFNGRSSWDLIGPEELSARGAWGITVKANNGKAFIAYSDQAQGGMVNVRQFDGTNWRQMGSNFASTVFTDAGALMALDSTDTPVIAYSHNTTTNKVEVMRLAGNQWAPQNDISSPSTPADIMTALEIAPNDQPVIAMTKTSFPKGYFAQVYQLRGQNWQATGEAVPGFPDLQLLGGTPFLSLSYFKEYPNWSSIDWGTVNIEDIGPKNYDMRKHGTVMKFSQGHREIIQRPAATVK